MNNLSHFCYLILVNKAKKYFYFELVVILMKMTMTGAMCVISPGTPEQLLIATFIMLTYMLVVLKTAPYENNIDDKIAFLVTVVLFINMLAGFTLLLDRDRPEKSFDVNAMGIGLIALNGMTLVVQVLNVILMKLSIYEKCNKKKKVMRTHSQWVKSTTEPSPRNGKNKNNSTKILPDAGGAAENEDVGEEVRHWGKKTST